MSDQLKTALIHGSLFLATFVTTTMAGASWAFQQNLVLENFEINQLYTWESFASGLPYSITFLLVITVHEFGHYIAARKYDLRPTLPFYLPMPPFAGLLGTLGAVIQIRRRADSMKQLFDVGIAGPLAGFIVALVLLFYGFQTLPEQEYIYTIHPEYLQYENYEDVVYQAPHISESMPAIRIGNSILFWAFENLVADADRVPNHYELPHYPVIFAGFLTLLLTALNLLPIGQLDGGHVLYGLVGYRKHRIVASIAFCVFLFYATLGMVPPGFQLELGAVSLPYLVDTPNLVLPHLVVVLLMIGLLYVCLRCLRLEPWKRALIAAGLFGLEYGTNYLFPQATGFSGWLLFAVLIGVLMPVMHPRAAIEEPLSTGRKILGWVSLVIFVICWSPRPFEIVI